VLEAASQRGHEPFQISLLEMSIVIYPEGFDRLILQCFNGIVPNSNGIQLTDIL